ncbi:MAG: CBS domain-containing protein [Bacteroidia bacterium]
MIVRNIMTTGHNWLEVDSTAIDADALAYDLEIFHLPVTNEGQFIGILHLDAITNQDIEEGKPIAESLDELEKFSISEQSFIFETLKFFKEFNLSAIPVVNESGLLSGLLTAQDVINYLSTTTSISNPGSFITLRLKTNDYNLQEISRIVESNNAQILSLHFEPVAAADELHCTIKINQKDLKHIIATFERFDYQLLAHSSATDSDDELKDRYDLLMKYLNI